MDYSKHTCSMCHFAKLQKQRYFCMAHQHMIYSTCYSWCTVSKPACGVTGHCMHTACTQRAHSMHTTGTCHFVIQLLSRDVGGQQAIGAGVQHAFDERLLRGWGGQLEDLEGCCLYDPVWSQPHALHLLLLVCCCNTCISHLVIKFKFNSILIHHYFKFNSGSKHQNKVTHLSFPKQKGSKAFAQSCCTFHLSNS